MGGNRPKSSSMPDKNRTRFTAPYFNLQLTALLASGKAFASASARACSYFNMASLLWSVVRWVPFSRTIYVPDFLSDGNTHFEPLPTDYSGCCMFGWLVCGCSVVACESQERLAPGCIDYGLAQLAHAVQVGCGVQQILIESRILLHLCDENVEVGVECCDEISKCSCSAPALRAAGPQFESERPDHSKNKQRARHSPQGESNAFSCLHPGD